MPPTSPLAVVNPAGTLQIDTTSPTVSIAGDLRVTGITAGDRSICAAGTCDADAQPERGGDGCGRHARR